MLYCQYFIIVIILHALMNLHTILKINNYLYGMHNYKLLKIQHFIFENV